jgi:hypothetical protein
MSILVKIYKWRLKVEEDEKTTITIKCDNKDLKLKAKEIAAGKGIDKLNEAYLQIFQLGLKEFKKL